MTTQFVQAFSRDGDQERRLIEALDEFSASLYFASRAVAACVVVHLFVLASVIFDLINIGPSWFVGQAAASFKRVIESVLTFLLDGN